MNSAENPTAVHAVLDVHDTPFNSLSWAPAGVWVLCNVQPLPFHASASGTGTPPLPMEDPTALQALLVVHDTPFRELSCAPLGLGVL